MIGQYAVEGAAGQTTGRVTDMWALLGLLAENRTTLLSRNVVQSKIWADYDARVDRFAYLLKDTRAKLCDALGRPRSHGKYVIQNIGAAGYRINPELFTYDIWLLRDALAQARRVVDDERASALTTAVGLFTGHYLPESPHSWGENASRTLDREIVQALAQLAKLESDPESAVLHLEKATELDPAAEHLYRQRMHLYAAMGRVEAVHHCYEQLNGELVLLGRKPESQTVDLYRQLAGKG